MIGYKGFDKNLKCKDFQYKEGETFKTNEAELGSKGFHFVENPLDLFGYYSPSDSVYHSIEAKDISDETKDDSKRVCKEITIGAKLDFVSLTKLGVDFILKNIKTEKNATGYLSAATNTGVYSAATNTGYRSAATNTGNHSAATNTGYSSAAIVSGKDSFAASYGVCGQAKGGIGCYLTLAEWVEKDDAWVLKMVKAIKVDGKKIKADTWYELKAGKFVEAKIEE